MRELSAPTHRRYRSNDYIVGEYGLVRYGGAAEEMMLAQTVHRGIGYQFMFFAPKGRMADNRARLEEVLSSFQLLKEE